MILLIFMAALWLLKKYKLFKLYRPTIALVLLLLLLLFVLHSHSHFARRMRTACTHFLWSVAIWAQATIAQLRGPRRACRVVKTAALAAWRSALGGAAYPPGVLHPGGHPSRAPIVPFWGPHLVLSSQPGDYRGLSLSRLGRIDC